MAEYINRALALREAEIYEKGITASIKVELKALPREDVIERSKIDKAIEEIKQEIQNGTIKITSGNEKLFNILENIGE